MANVSLLGAAQRFAVLGATTVTNSGPTIILGDLGVSPGTAVTGFPPGVVNGTIFAGGPLPTQAQGDLAIAYGVLAGEVPTTILPSGQLGGLTLLPGVYQINPAIQAAQLTGTLTLDAQNDPNACFSFQIGTTLITAANSAVNLINGAQGDNVFFQVGTSATLGVNTAFAGNILANTSITLSAGASIAGGRALAVNSAVTLVTNSVSISPPLLLINDVTVNESAGTATFTVTLSRASGQTITVNAATADGLAVAPGDYTITTTPLTFTPGVITQTFTVPVTNDALNEPTEFFTANLSGAVNAGIADAIGVATILDDDPLPSLSINDVTVGENAGPATFTLTLSAASGQTVSVNFATAQQTATAPADYQDVAGTLTFLPGGPLTQTIGVPIVNDAVSESTETFLVNLTAPINANITDGVGLGSILDDEPPGSPSIDVEKAINAVDPANPTPAEDADAAPGVLIPVGNTPTFTYLVTNTGNVNLSAVSVADDGGFNASFNPLPVLQAAPNNSFNIGDLNLDSLLNPDPDGAGPLLAETWRFTSAGLAIPAVVAGQYTNFSTATGTPPVGTPVTDTDPGNLFGSTPAIDVEKAINAVVPSNPTPAEDADAAPGVLIPVGNTPTFTYLVTNTGNVNLSNVSVADDGGFNASFNPLPVLQAAPNNAFNIGDLNQDGLLNPDPDGPAGPLGEVFQFTSTGVAIPAVIAGPYTNLSIATGTPPVGTPVTDTDPGNLFGSSPSPISLLKLTNGSNNDDPATTGPIVRVGDIVTFTYQVTNTGNAPLTNVTVVDDNGTPGFTADDVTLAIPGTLAIGAATSVTATRVATAGQYANLATATGTPPVGPPVSATNSDRHFGTNSRISLVKLTNGTDNDDPTATGPLVRVGDTVIFTYNITNTGNVPLTNVAVIDDNGTPGNTADDLTLTVSGTLAAGATTALTATRIATAGPYTNIATATGTPPIGSPVTDSNPDNHFGFSPAISLVKLTNGTNNDSPATTGPIVRVGNTVTFTYNITNTGNVPLINVTLLDDNGTPGNAADDVTLTVPGTLAAGASTALTATRIATAGQYINSATATGTPPVGTPVSATNPDRHFGQTTSSLAGIVYFDNNSNGVLDPAEPGIGGVLLTLSGTDVNSVAVGLTATTAADGSYSFAGLLSGTYTVTETQPAAFNDGLDAAGTAGGVVGNDVISAIPLAAGTNAGGYTFGETGGGIDIVKLTNGTDNNTAPGPFILADSTVTFTYIVTNTGNVPLSGITVTDDRGVVPVLRGGDTNANGLLDITESWTFTATTLATPGPYTNVGTATGIPPVGPPVSASDADNHFGSAPAINIVTLTNDTNNDTPPGPIVQVGSSVTFTYIVTNAGNVPLSGITVTDDRGVTPVLQGGDSNANGLLDITETWTFTAGRNATSGPYTNVGTATGSPPPGGGPAVADSDPDNHTGFLTGAGIDIVKLTNGTDNPTAPGPFLPVGSTVTFTYVVTNTGNQPLSNVVVRDDNGTPLDPTDDFNALFVGGDSNGNGVLDPDPDGAGPQAAETWTFTASRPAVTGQRTNLGIVTALPPVGGIPSVTDTDLDNDFGSAPGINVVKLTNGTDNDTPPGPAVPAGSTVTFTYIVTNTGNVPLSGITVTDDRGLTPVLQGGDTNANGLLDITESWTFTATTVATPGPYNNVGTATGTPPVGSPVTDTNPDNHFGRATGGAPNIALVTLANGLDANTAPGPLVLAGSTVRFTYVVTNTGNQPLSRVTVVDDNGTPGNPTDDFNAAFAGGDADGDGLLDLDETFTFTASRIATVGQFTNNATAAGVPPLGPAVTDSDPSNHEGCSLTVTSAGDSGPGSLRAAIECANLIAGPDRIDFAIPGQGPFTIRLASALPEITESLVIDGYTQPGSRPNTREVGNDAVLLIVLNGAAAGPDAVGLRIPAAGSGSTVRGLVIQQFNEVGIRLRGGRDTLVAGNFLGTDAAGTRGPGAGLFGVLIQGGSDNTIGGTTPAARNVISGHRSVGVRIFGNSQRNVVQGNFIGTDSNGTAPLPNAFDGLFIDGGASGNTIGGTAPGSGNVISGNGSVGVQIFGASGNVVQGNRIGTDATGSSPLGNNDGVFLNRATGNTIGGTAPGAGNLISANSFVGVQILGPGSSGNVVEGNRIGTDAEGNSRTGFGNRFGLFLNAAPGNTVGTGNIVRGNAAGDTIDTEAMAAMIQDARSIADGPVVTEIVLTFSQDMNPARVQDRRNYRLRPAGRGRMIAIESATYDPLTRSVTLRLREPIDANISLRLMVNGTSRRGVADARGRLLDGNGDGRPGGNFVTRLGSPATSRTPVETAESGVIPLPGSPQGPARGRISARAVDHLLRSEGLSAPSRPPRPRAIHARTR